MIIIINSSSSSSSSSSSYYYYCPLRCGVLCVAEISTTMLERFAS